VSVRIYQQVNLFQPIFRRQRQIFSAALLLPSLGVFVLALAAISGFGYVQVRGLESEAVLLEGRERAQSAQLASLDPSSGVSRRAEVEAELARLSAALLEQQRLVDILEEQPLGTMDGFSEILAALGRRRKSGLWLTRIDIDGGSGGVELTGKSIAPELIPAFLLGLGEETALSGLRFDAFEVERDLGDEIEFSVASRAVLDSGASR
jgi:hypothetical protein